MIKAIVSLKNGDEWAEVGMNYRTIIGPYVREEMVRRKCGEYARGKPHRIEFFAGDSILGTPYKVETHGG